MPRRRKEMFLWVAPNRTTKWTVTINGEDVTDFVLEGSEFPHGLITEELNCTVILDNSGEDFTNKFTARHEIIFKMDFSGGSTVQFKGEVEKADPKIEDGSYLINIKGAHFTAQLLDVMVTEEFKSAKISVIRKSLIDTYLPDFTYDDVEENTNEIDIKFINKPFLDCFIILDDEGNEDTYIDFDKDFHTFKRGSKVNNNEALVDDDNMFDLRGLGKDSADVRNNIQVIGDAGGLPVIATSEDSSSQSEFRTKESIIQDSNIKNENQAQELGDAEKTRKKNPEAQGSTNGLFMPQLIPGYMTYIISSIHKIHARYRPVKFVFKVPEEEEEVFFSEEKGIPKLFKDRIKKELSQENIVNPFKMKYSFNFGSDAGFIESKMDTTASREVEIVEGNLKWTGSGEDGEMISIKKDTPITVTSVSLQIKGETLEDITYYVNADGTNNWQVISKDTEVPVDSGKQGQKLRLRIKLANSSTRIPSIALLYK